MIVKMDNFLDTLLWKSDESRAHSLLKRKRLLLKSKYWCNHSFFVFVFCTQVSRLKRNKKIVSLVSSGAVVKKGSNAYYKFAFYIYFKKCSTAYKKNPDYYYTI